MSLHALRSSEPPHNDMEVYSHSNLEVIDRPQFPPVENNKNSIHQNIDASTPQYQAEAPLPQRIWMSCIVPSIIAAVVSAVTVGGAVGGVLGASLASF